MRAGVNECRQKARACCKREETKRFALIFMGQKRQMRLTSVWCQRVVNTLLAPQMCKQINSPPSHAAMHSWSAKTLSPLVLEERKRHLVCRSILSFAVFVCRRRCSMCQGGTSRWPYHHCVSLWLHTPEQQWNFEKLIAMCLIYGRNVLHACFVWYCIKLIIVLCLFLVKCAKATLR